MTRPRYFLIAAGLLLMATLAALLLRPAPVDAQGSCRAMCWESYGACYKATNNRQRCQAQLQRCLNSCIRSRRR